MDIPRWIGDNLTPISNMGGFLLAVVVFTMRLWSRKEHQQTQEAIQENAIKLDKVVQAINGHE